MCGKSQGPPANGMSLGSKYVPFVKSKTGLARSTNFFMTRTNQEF